MNSNSLKVYVYYNDGSSSQWVAARFGTGGNVTGSVTTYANLAAFPSSATASALGFAQDTKSLYVYDGTEWDRIFAGADMMPEFTTPPAASYNLNGSTGAAQNITVVATDAEGFPITYSHDTNPTNQQQATISQSTNVFTVTPSTSQSDIGSFTMRFKATDGVNVSSVSSTMNLVFAKQAWDIDSGQSEYVYTDAMDFSSIRSFGFYVTFDNNWGYGSGSGRFWTTSQGSNVNTLYLSLIHI